MSETSEPTATVLTHGRPEQVGEAIETIVAAACEHGWTLRFDDDAVARHGLITRSGVELGAELSDDVDLCFTLGGDGTILRGLRHYAGTGVPTFAINYGEVGFLATIDREEIDAGIERAFAGDYELMTLPALALEMPPGEGYAAINDVSFHRKVGGRVATLAYSVGGQEVGRIRCDGLVVATPAGSTGYNLANGGPVMAWGVEGYVVSFIAPHSLTARALVVSPDDVLTVENRGFETIDVLIDGRPASELAPGGTLASHFVREAADLAQMPGSSFYLRVRERFGRLAS